MKKPFNKMLPETEQRNKKSLFLHKLHSSQILRLINREDQLVPWAVKNTLPLLNIAIQSIVSSLLSGGRIFYVGAGTSGRLGIMDASECPPTFGVLPELFQGKIAGNFQALLHSQENAEDRIREAVRIFTTSGITKLDVIIGITASGLTPFVLEFMKSARRLGCKTILISSNRLLKKIQTVDLTIKIPTGPEIVTGSTRMKAGTAQKLILNLISTVSLIRCGKVFENLMVDLLPISNKLVNRKKRNLRYLKFKNVDNL